MSDPTHLVDDAIGQWSDVYVLRYEHGVWYARLRPRPGPRRRWRERELVAVTWRELRRLMIADVARRQHP